MMNCSSGHSSEYTRAIDWRVIYFLGCTCITINLLLMFLVQILSTEAYKKKSLCYVFDKNSKPRKYIQNILYMHLIFSQVAVLENKLFIHRGAYLSWESELLLISLMKGVSTVHWDSRRPKPKQ